MSESMRTQIVRNVITTTSEVPLLEGKVISTVALNSGTVVVTTTKFVYTVYTNKDRTEITTSAAFEQEPVIAPENV